MKRALNPRIDPNPIPEPEKPRPDATRADPNARRADARPGLERPETSLNKK